MRIIQSLFLTIALISILIGLLAFGGGLTIPKLEKSNKSEDRFDGVQLKISSTRITNIVCITTPCDSKSIEMNLTINNNNEDVNRTYSCEEPFSLEIVSTTKWIPSEIKGSCHNEKTLTIFKGTTDYTYLTMIDMNLNLLDKILQTKAPQTIEVRVYLMNTQVSSEIVSLELD